jgi:hypothetical protein
LIFGAAGISPLGLLDAPAPVADAGLTATSADTYWASTQLEDEATTPAAESVSFVTAAEVSLVDSASIGISTDASTPTFGSSTSDPFALPGYAGLSTPESTSGLYNPNLGGSAGSGFGGVAPPTLGAGPSAPVEPASSGGVTQSGGSQIIVPPPAPPTGSGSAFITGFKDGQGALITNGITNTPNPTVIGIGNPGASVTVSIDGTAAGRTTVDTHGNWSFAVSNPLSDGDHRFAVSTAGNATNTGTTVLNVDAVPPAVTLQVPAFADYRPPTFQVAVTDDSGFDPTFHIDIDLQHDGSFTDPGDHDYATGTLAADGTGSVQLAQALPTGIYSIRARVSDSAGNEGISSIATMNVNTNAGYLASEPLFDLAYGFPYGTSFATPNGEQVVLRPDEIAQYGLVPVNQPPMTDPTRMMMFDNQGNVEINVHATAPQFVAGMQGDLQALGMNVMTVNLGQNMVTGFLPVNSLTALDQLANFDSVTPVYHSIVRAFESEGDAVIKAPQFRASQNVNGTGIKVGVISDSVNQVRNPVNPAQVGIAWTQSFGELLGGVQILEDGIPSPGTDEGRAMLEIVDDVAPGATLAFHAANSEQDFADGIRALAAAGCNVIVDDIGFSDEPMFNDGAIAQAVNQVTAQGVTYVTAGGNDANMAYSANWRSITATVGTINGTFQNIAGGSPLQTFSLAVGAQTSITMDWDAAFMETGTPLHGTGNFQVRNDVEVVISNATGTRVFARFDPMALSTNEANAFVTFLNNGTFGTTNFAMSFHLKTGAAPNVMRWVSVFGGPDPLALGEGAPALYGHVLATGAITVAAADQATPTVPESFTSLGGNMPIFFDQNGARLSSMEIRPKPDVTGPDGVHTTFFAQPDGSGGFQFFGTSAAAPHVAGAAALLLQQAQGATPLQIAQHLKQTAVDIGPPGYDFLTGFGMIQLVPFTVPPPVQVFGPDVFDLNDTSDTAHDFGTMPANATQDYPHLTIANEPSGLPNYDWFRWAAATGGTFSANLKVTQGGPLLELHLFTLQGVTLVELAHTQGGSAGVTLTALVGAGQPILVEVKGVEVSLGVQTQGEYELKLGLH